MIWNLEVEASELLKAFDYALSNPPASTPRREAILPGVEAPLCWGVASAGVLRGGLRAGPGGVLGVNAPMPSPFATGSMMGATNVMVKLKYSSTTRQLYVTTLKPPAAALPEAGCPGQAVYLLV